MSSRFVSYHVFLCDRCNRKESKENPASSALDKHKWPGVPVGWREITVHLNPELLRLLEKAEDLLARCQTERLVPCDLRSSIRKYFSDDKRGHVIHTARETGC